MERAVVGDDLAGEERETDDDEKDCVQTGASDEQTCPEREDVKPVGGQVEGAGPCFVNF